MSLVSLKPVLSYAEKTKTAIPAFNIDTLPSTEAMLEAAQEANCPVILTIGQAAIKEGRMETLCAIVRRLAEDSTVPVVLHLDHSNSYDQIVRAIRMGFSSVMYDGSHGPLADNIRESQAVVRTAHAVGVSVECELGAIMGVEDGMSHDRPNLVDLDEVRRFIAEVDCDALAVGIGNAHGIYKSTPNLDFDRLQACRDMGAPHLVLHGGSGIPDDMLRRAITIGIRKINVATELRLAYLKGLREVEDPTDFYGTLRSGKAAVKALAAEKIRIFQGK